MNVYTNIIPCMFMPMKSQMKSHYVCFTYTHHRIKMYKNLIQLLLFFSNKKTKCLSIKYNLFYEEYMSTQINVLKQSAPLWIW